MLATPLSLPLTHCWTVSLGLDQSGCENCVSWIFWSSTDLSVVAEGVALADIKGETLLNQVKITQFEGISGGRWEAVYAVAASMVSNDVKYFIHSPLLSISLSAKKQIHIWLALVQLGKISLYLKRGRQLEMSYPSSSQVSATSRLPMLPSTTTG